MTGPAPRCTFVVGGRKVVVAMPRAERRGALSVDVAAAIAQARAEGADAYLLRSGAVADEVLFRLQPAAGVNRGAPGGAAAAWLRARWRAAAVRQHARTRQARASTAFWLEVHRELRRHIGDARLPYTLRTRLRELAQGALARSARRARQTVEPLLPRRLLRVPPGVTLPSDVEAAARRAADVLGISGARPLVLVEADASADRCGAAVEALAAEGYQVVGIGDAAERWRHPALLDAGAAHDRRLEAYLLLRADFLVCTTADAQQVAYLTGTPTLALNAVDPLLSYPIRRDGIFTVATAVELDSGRSLTPAEMLEESYLRQLERYGHRRNTPAEIAAAVREMQSGLRDGWRETAAQARYRALAEAAGAALAARVPRVAAWGPEDGFLGDGRLAACQAGEAA